MSKTKIGNRHDSMASQGKVGKRKVSVSSHKKGHLEIEVGHNKRRSHSKTGRKKSI